MKIDILCLSETWLRADTSNDQIAVQGYQIIRSDKMSKGRGGGLCSYVLDKYLVNSTKYRDLDVNSQQLETLTYELNLPQTRPIVLIQFYRPPNGAVEQAFESLQNIVEGLKGNPEILVLGDMNLNYLDPNPNSNFMKKIKKIENYNQLLSKNQQELPRVGPKVSLTTCIRIQNTSPTVG